MINLKSTMLRYIRVLQIARKPSREEFLNASKICSIGIFAIGIIGFLIFLAFILLVPA
jgi:protein transport protein SEC61 subunit gamma-like protein